MIWLRRLVVATAGASLAAGAVFFVAAAEFLVRYYTDVESPLRHELMVGVTYCLVYSAGAFVLAAFLASLARPRLSPTAARWLTWPGLVVGGVTFLLYVASIAVSLLAGKL